MKQTIKISVLILVGILTGIIGTLWYQAIDKEVQEIKEKEELSKVDTLSSLGSCSRHICLIISCGESDGFYPRIWIVHHLYKCK